MKTTEELKKLDNKKFLEELQNSKKELFKARFEVATNQEKNNRIIRKYRKYIAKMQTLLNNH